MINYTQGDNLPITLTCSQLNLAGAVITVAFRSATDGSPDVVIPSTQVVIDPDQTANKGKFVVTPSSSDSAQFAVGTQLDILAKVVQAGTTTTFRGKRILNVFKATLR